MRAIATTELASILPIASTKAAGRKASPDSGPASPLETPAATSVAEAPLPSGPVIAESANVTSGRPVANNAAPAAPVVATKSAGDADLMKEAESMQTAGKVMVGLTAASLATAVALLFFTDFKGGEEEPVSETAWRVDGVSPILTGDGGGRALCGRF